MKKPVNPEPVVEDARGKFWLSMSDIKWVDSSSIVHIPTGLIQLDGKIGGFALGDVTVVSGLSGAGKTTILNQFALSAIQHGYKVAAWSGELQGQRFQSWLDQMAAGRDLVKRKTTPYEFFYAPQNVCAEIHKWLDGKFWLFNNEYGSEWELLQEKIRDIVKEQGVQLILLDNLMALDLDGPSSDNDL